MRLGADDRVGKHRTIWHVLFANLLRQRGPRWLEVRDEVPLSDEPLRVDYLLLRRVPEISLDDPGRTLRGLWHRLPPTTIAELKTIGRPYRPRNLDRLLGYLHIYFSAEDLGDAPIATSTATSTGAGASSRRPRAVERAGDLAGLLVVPARTPTLKEEIAARGLVWTDLGSGYAELTGGLFRLFVAEVDVVAEEEDDDVLRLFGHRHERTLEARRFWAAMFGSKEARMSLEDMEGYKEAAKRILETLPLEDRLEGVTAGEVVRVVGADTLLPELPIEVLRALSTEFIEKLPEPTRSAVRTRLAG